MLKKKSVLERVDEFHDEALEREDRWLFCGACWIWLHEKKSNVAAHVKSMKCFKSKEDRRRERLKEQSLLELIKGHDVSKRPVGETLPERVRIFRLKVVKTLLTEGILLAKADGLRSLLESDGLQLTASSHLAEYIPVLLAEEFDCIKNEVVGGAISVIFDGKTRLGEAVAILSHYVTDDWEIKQRLVRMQTVSKAVSAQQLAQLLNECLSLRNNVHHEQVVAMMRDGVAFNTAAVRTLSVLYSNAMDVTCFSHTLNNTAARFQFDALDDFGQNWVSLFSHSHGAKLAW